MTRKQTDMIVNAIDNIITGLGQLKQAVAELEEPVSLVDKYLPEFEATQSKLKPISEPVEHCEHLGDASYKNSFNPVRQVVGRLGGLATAGVKRVDCPDRRKPGTVMVKNMSVNEKRRYWRWSKFRAMQRAAGAEPVSWAAWVGERG